MRTYIRHLLEERMSIRDGASENRKGRLRSALGKVVRRRGRGSSFLYRADADADAAAQAGPPLRPPRSLV